MVEKKAKAGRPAKKAPVKTVAKKKVAKGDSYACGVCGLSVTVEQVGNIVYEEESPIICCGKPMKAKKAKTKAKTANK